MGRVIAITGKGGTGKTAVAALLVRYLIKSGRKYRVLVIDADPDSNLADALGVEVTKTVGDMREFMQEARYTTPPDTDKERLFEAKIFEILVEERGYDLLVMGKPEGSGCYCFVNNLLRGIMDRLIDQYDITIIDTAAGLEHFSRKVIPDLDSLIVVTDSSRRGLTTGERIRELASELGMKYNNLYVIANKVTEGNKEKIIENARSVSLNVIGTIPYDERLANFDLVGDPLINLPDDAPSVKEIEEHVVKALGI